MKYKIGDVSKAFCLSKNALRYYEEHGVLLPTHDEGSSYRYYDDEQMHRVGTLKKLRNMGLSVDEITQFMPSSTIKEVEALMTACLKEQERQAALHRYLADKLQADLSRIRDSASFGHISRRALPERYELQLGSIENLVKDRELQKFAPAWFDHVFPVMNIHRLDLRDVAEGRYAPFFALSVDALGAQLLGLDTGNSFVQHRSAQDCLNLCNCFRRFQQEETLGFLYLDQCQALLRRCEAEGLTPADSFYFNILFACREADGTSEVIGDIYLPVRAL